MSEYRTRNTDCRDSGKDEAGFHALSRLMLADIKDWPNQRRTPGKCACCGRALAVAYRIFDLKTEDAEPKAYELAPGDTERIAKALELVDGPQKVGSFGRFLAFRMYHCDILLDRWRLDPQTGRLESPLDAAKRLRDREIAEAKAAFASAAPKRSSTGLERLEALAR